MWVAWRRYRQPTGQNATGLARRFTSLAGLKLLLVQELEAMQAARARALQPLNDLVTACTNPSEQVVQQVGVAAPPVRQVCMSDASSCEQLSIGLGCLIGLWCAWCVRQDRVLLCVSDATLTGMPLLACGFLSTNAVKVGWSFSDKQGQRVLSKR